jgi:hypothetical protein
LSEYLQVGFWVRGLVAPEKEIVFDDWVLIRGMPPSDDASVFFKVTMQKEEEREKLTNDCLNSLKNLLQIYGLVSDNYAKVPSGWASAKISSEHPFGSLEHLGGSLVAVLDENQRNRQIPNLKKTIEKYDSTKSIFQNKNQAFLKNAIDYYYRSLGDDRLEEKLIDLMIALESLFSKENDELALRYSLRAAFLLGVGKEDERSLIVENMKKLYRKRSKVVHGTGAVDLSYQEMDTFQRFVKEAIKRMLHIGMTKSKFLELLDQAVYDENKYKTLNAIVNEAIEKW